jgi:hypothetical protein
LTFRKKRLNQFLILLQESRPGNKIRFFIDKSITSQSSKRPVSNVNTNSQNPPVPGCQRAVPLSTLQLHCASFKKGKIKAAKGKQKRYREQQEEERATGGKQPKKKAFLFLPPTSLTFTHDSLFNRPLG